MHQPQGQIHTRILRWLMMVLLTTGLAACLAGPPVTTLTPDQSGTLRFPTLTLPENAILVGAVSGTPATAVGVLRLPVGSPERVPAVVLAHGCGGVSAGVIGWATLLPTWGIATFQVDSFTDRGLNEVCTGRQQITLGSRLTDVYRALELLTTHPRIDPERIALMGSSQGGRVTLTASFVRFQRLLAPQGRHFAAHLAF